MRGNLEVIFGPELTGQLENRPRSPRERGGVKGHRLAWLGASANRTLRGITVL